MLEKDDGVVLKTAKSGETSLMVTFLSRKLGKIRLMAKGARTARSQIRGLLESGNHIEVLYYFKEGRSVYYLKEATQLSGHFAARDSLIHMAARLAAMELLDQVCYPGSADENIVRLAAEYVRCGKSADPLFVFLAFELRLLEALGVLPELSACVRCGGALEGGYFSARNGSGICARHAEELSGGGTDELLLLSPGILDAAVFCLENPFHLLETEEADRSVRKQLGKIIHWTYTYHVQGYSLPVSLSLI